ncbi:MAG: SAP domain-containing protein [Nitrospirae bacterium]|nr:SAP domain-containing protein [Nitrospirota bacterium]
MKTRDIKMIAGKKGIKPGAMKKEELIRAIQRAEGNFDCFATSRVRGCGQVNCLWKEDCVSAS